PAQRQIEPAALRQESRGSREDAVDAVKSKPVVADKHEDVARLELKRPRWMLPRKAADSEDGAVSERHRHNRRGEVLLVLVLMQPHLGVAAVVVDEAGLRVSRIAGDLPPEIEQWLRHRRPGLASHRMRRLIVIAQTLVGDP